MAYCCSDFDILLEHIRTGEELPADHHLIQEKNLIEDAVKKVMAEIGTVRPGPARKARVE